MENMDQNVSVSDSFEILESLKQQLQDYQATDLLIGQVLHDMNNLFHILGSYLSLGGFLDDEANAELWELLSHNMRKTLSRLRRQTGESCSVDAVSLIQKMVCLLRIRFQDVNFRFLSSLTMVELPMSENQLFLILLNLCTNACTAMQLSKDKNVEIVLRPFSKEQKSYCCLSVHDTGCGIEPANRIKIFQAYFTSKNELHGHGLGLAIVKSMLEELGGYIEVESEVNIGTAFHLYFPMSE